MTPITTPTIAATPAIFARLRASFVTRSAPCSFSRSQPSTVS